MEWKDFVNGMEELQETATKYLEMYEDKMTDFLRSKDMSPEDNLQKEMILELLEHVHGICHLTEYAARETIRTGILHQREDGELEFDGDCLPLMTELEVLVYDEACGREVWTRTYVGGVQRKYLVGMKKQRYDMPVKIRIRE